MSWFSDLFGDEEESSASKQYRSSIKEFDKIPLPTEQELTLALQRMVQLGQITPEMATTMYQQNSELYKATTDPKLYNAQLDSLSSLQDISKNDGLTAMDRAQLNDIDIQEATRLRGEQEALQNSMASRGISGSGQELASRMIAEQGAADRQSAQGVNVAALAQKRALDAISQSGTLAGSMREQDFSEQSQKAKAQDAINQFNTQMKQQTENTNVAARNASQTQNLNQAYNIQKTNLEQSNRERESVADAAQKDFDNRYRIAAGKAGQISGYADSLNTQSKNTADSWGAGIKALSDTDWFSDENLKKDVNVLTNEEVNDFLDNLTGYSYRYKGSNEPGMGVMAQDIEKTPMEDNVVDTPKGKMVKGDGAMKSAMLAALANINNRVNELEGK